MSRWRTGINALSPPSAAGSSQEAEITGLRARLAETEQLLQAIQAGEVDALVIRGQYGHHLYSLTGAERIYRKLVETMQESALTLSNSGTILYCNQSFARQVERPMEQCIGEPLGRYLAPPQQAEFAALLQEASTRSVKRLFTLRTTSDRLIPSQFSASRLESELDGVLCLVITDLTELTRAEEQFRFAMDATSDGIWDWDLLTNTVYFSPGYIGMLGYAGNEIRPDVGSWMEALHPDERAAIFAEIRQRLIDPGHFELEYRMRTRTGSYRWILCRGKTVVRDPAGRPHRCVGTHVDITERKEANLALRESERRYRELSADLEKRVADRTGELVAANAAKTRFLAHMSHELRTPMNAVLGFAQVLDLEGLTSEQRHMVGMIRQAGEGMLSIVNDLLDLASIESGALRMERRPFDPKATLAHVAHMARQLARGKGLALEVEICESLRDKLVGDGHRLHQVLLNLLGNAVKFTERGKISLSVQEREADPGQQRLRFVIADTGIGMSDEVMARLFTPFEQGDASITRSFGGAGLGLAISKRLVERMGGALGVESRPGQGSTFWFEVSFPRVPAKGCVPGADKGGPTSTTASLSGWRVLAVDDNPINLRMIEKALTRLGAVVTLAIHGREALDRLGSGPEPFDVVLMDVQMPVMDGIEATREIRRDPALAGLPVIALTAGVLTAERQAALDAGMNDFLAKPLDLARMVEALRAHRPARLIVAPDGS